MHDCSIPMKTEVLDDNSTELSTAILSEQDDSLPDYENSMLARSLLSGKEKDCIIMLNN